MKEIEMILPQDIEKRSFEIIEAELQQMNIVLPQEQEAITKRVIHTSADFSYACGGSYFTCDCIVARWSTYCDRYEYGKGRDQ